MSCSGVGLALLRGFEVTRNPDLLALDVTRPNAEHHLRSGLDVTISRRAGMRLRILVVHLKTGCLAPWLRRERLRIRAQCCMHNSPFCRRGLQTARPSMFRSC